jgi:hypothetical protein
MDDEFLAGQPITCTGERQRVTVPFSADQRLVPGNKVFLTVTVSGDSGEILDWGTFVVHK